MGDTLLRRWKVLSWNIEWVFLDMFSLCFIYPFNRILIDSCIHPIRRSYSFNRQEMNFPSVNNFLVDEFQDHPVSWYFLIVLLLYPIKRTGRKFQERSTGTPASAGVPECLRAGRLSCKTWILQFLVIYIWRTFFLGKQHVNETMFHLCLSHFVLRSSSFLSKPCTSMWFIPFKVDSCMWGLFFSTLPDKFPENN